jgi:FkbM family methyltransferase
LLGRGCVAKFRDGNRFVIRPDQLPNYSFIREMVSDNLNGRGPKVRIMTDREFGQVLDLNGYKFVIAPEFSFDSLYLAFFRQWFSHEDLSGYEVIDIGAYSGDTAIYFASKGARVHAYEPVPEAYEMMRRNVALNGLDTTVITYNCAVTNDVASTMWVDRSTYEGSSSFAMGASIESNETKIHVKSVSIKDALARCAPQSRKLLKMNCEGCEFAIVSKTNGEFLKTFHEIVCFYHSHLTGIPKEKLIEVMQENGFEVLVNDSQSLIIAKRREAQVMTKR